MSTVRLLVPFNDINKRINVRAEIVPVELCAVIIAFAVIDYICFAESLCVFVVLSSLNFLKLIANFNFLLTKISSISLNGHRFSSLVPDVYSSSLWVHIPYHLSHNCKANGSAILHCFSLSALDDLDF